MAFSDDAPAVVPSPASGSEVRLLVVDDEEGARDTLGSIFAEKGYQVQMAATGREALEKAAHQRFDIAILDVRLPDMNGTELLGQLKELQPDTSCIMVTGYASIQTCIRAVNGGAFSYLLKPLDMDHLLSVTLQAVEQQHSVTENQRQLDQCRERIRALESSETQLSERVQRLEQELSAVRGRGS